MSEQEKRDISMVISTPYGKVNLRGSIEILEGREIFDRIFRNGVMRVAADGWQTYEKMKDHEVEGYPLRALATPDLGLNPKAVTLYLHKLAKGGLLSIDAMAAASDDDLKLVFPEKSKMNSKRLLDPRGYNFATAIREIARERTGWQPEPQEEV